MFLFSSIPLILFSNVPVFRCSCFQISPVIICSCFPLFLFSSINVFLFQMIIFSDHPVFGLVPLIPLCCSAFLFPFTDLFLIPCCSSVFLFPFTFGYSEDTARVHWGTVRVQLGYSGIFFFFLFPAAARSSCYSFNHLSLSTPFYSSVFLFPFTLLSIIIPFYPCSILSCPPFFLSCFVFPAAALSHCQVQVQVLCYSTVFLFPFTFLSLCIPCCSVLFPFKFSLSSYTLLLLCLVPL